MQIATKSIFDRPLERPSLIPGIRLGAGWHVGESVAWSRSQKSRLVVNADHFPDPKPLLLRLNVFNAAPYCSKHLRVASPGHAPVTVKVTTPDPVTLLLHTPRHPEDARESEIVFELDRLDSPFLTGRSSDERLLGLSITDLVPDAPALAFPLEFRGAGAATSVLLEGWAAPDTHGTWSIGRRAVLHLPGHLSPGRPTELVFEGSALPLPRDRAPLEVDVFEAGTLLATWRIDNDTPARWRCPLPDWSSNSDRRIELFIRNARSPSSLGINVDNRPLGMLLKQIYLAD